MAARIRSRLSRTLESGSPTVAKLGKPFTTSTSTQMPMAWMPWRPTERTRAITRRVWAGGARAVNASKRIRPAGPAGSAIQSPLEEPQQTLGHEDHHRGEDDAHGDEVVLREVTGEPLAQEEEECGARDGADQGPYAAHHVENHHL